MALQVCHITPRGERIEASELSISTTTKDTKGRVSYERRQSFKEFMSEVPTKGCPVGS